MNFQMLAMKSAGLLTAGTVLWIGSAVAAPLSSQYPSHSGAPIESVVRGYAAEETEIPGLAPELQRQVVVYPARVPEIHQHRTPPLEMIGRQPYLPRWMAGGESNPLGARAIYLGSTVYRIHGTNMPETIGHKVSSGCIRMLNADVVDLYSRVDVGTKVIVLPNNDYVATVAASVVSAHLVAPRSNDLHTSNIY